MVVPGILPDLLHSIELLEKHQEREGMREGHGGKRDSFVYKRRENGLVHSVCPSYHKHDVWVGYFGFLDHKSERFGGKNLWRYIAIDHESLLLLEKLPNPVTLLLADDLGILRFFRFDNFVLRYSSQTTKVFLDRFSEMGVGIGNSDDGDHIKKW